MDVTEPKSSDKRMGVVVAAPVLDGSIFSPLTLTLTLLCTLLTLHALLSDSFIFKNELGLGDLCQCTVLTKHSHKWVYFQTNISQGRGNCLIHVMWGYVKRDILTLYS